MSLNTIHILYTHIHTHTKNASNFWFSSTTVSSSCYTTIFGKIIESYRVKHQLFISLPRYYHKVSTGVFLLPVEGGRRWRRGVAWERHVPTNDGSVSRRLWLLSESRNHIDFSKVYSSSSSISNEADVATFLSGISWTNSKWRGTAYRTIAFSKTC